LTYKGDVVPIFPDAILDVHFIVVLTDRVHAMSTGKPGGFFGLASPVSKGARQVAHLPRGRKCPKYGPAIERIS
jgi:hypothetical protein